MPVKTAIFAARRSVEPKMIHHNGDRYTVLCDCNRPPGEESEADRLYGSELKRRDFAKCPICGYYPWISLAQDRWRKSRYLSPSRRSA